MINKIDSIIKAKSIDKGKVLFHRVASTGSQTSTESSSLSSIQKITFDGPFLVIGGSYFNMDKLLFFFKKGLY